jgi:hypothetical protein
VSVKPEGGGVINGSGEKGENEGVVSADNLGAAGAPFFELGLVHRERPAGRGGAHSAMAVANNRLRGRAGASSRSRSASLAFVTSPAAAAPRAAVNGASLPRKTHAKASRCRNLRRFSAGGQLARQGAGS